jgi:hypothetical protein
MSLTHFLFFKYVLPSDSNEHIHNNNPEIQNLWIEVRIQQLKGHSISLQFSIAKKWKHFILVVKISQFATQTF